MRTEVRDVAVGHWPFILQAAGIDEVFLQNIHGPCPCCGGTDRFRFDNKRGEGTFFCSSCRAGDGLKLLMLYKGLGFKEAAQFVRDVLNDQPVEKTIRPKVDYVAQDMAKKAAAKVKLQKTWDYSKPVKKGDPVWKYLAITRNLPLASIPGVLHFHPRFPYYEKNEKKENVLVGKYPMMLAKIQDKNGTPVGLHRTYLTQDGKKAPVAKPKKLMEGLGVSGGAIRLFPCETELGVTEGIETALAVNAMTGQPVWACISSTILAMFEPPPGVTTITIYADNDVPDQNGRRAGQDDAAKLAERLRSEGYKVRIIVPFLADTDFHDVWLARLKTQEARAKARLNMKSKRSERADASSLKTTCFG